MEGSAAATDVAPTGSKTIADLAARAAESHSDAVAVRFKRDGAWHDVTFAEVGAIVSEIGRGLVDLGIAAGEGVCLLANTRPEWTYWDFAIAAAGGVVVPIYQTNSPEECAWVVGNSEAVAVICEDAGQLAKILEVRDRLPALRHLIVMDPGDGTEAALPLDELRARGRALGEDALRERTDAVTSDDPFTFIYTSGTTGPPKGCVLTHGNYRAILDSTRERQLFHGEDDLVSLFLPLAHAFALLVQLGAIDSGT